VSLSVVDDTIAAIRYCQINKPKNRGQTTVFREALLGFSPHREKPWSVPGFPGEAGKKNIINQRPDPQLVFFIDVKFTLNCIAH
jgi:hypothetical protein